MFLLLHSLVSQLGNGTVFLFQSLMQHAGVHYGQGVSVSHHLHHHPTEQYTPSEVQVSVVSGRLRFNACICLLQAHTGSTTTALRQWRKKENTDKQSVSDNSSVSVVEGQGQIARVAPHTHYPRPELYRYPNQYNDYGCVN